MFNINKQYKQERNRLKNFHLQNATNKQRLGLEWSPNASWVSASHLLCNLGHLFMLIYLRIITI